MTIILNSHKGTPYEKIGEVIERFNLLEARISNILSQHLGILDEEKSKILFNSSILHFGGKIKLLANFKIGDDKMPDKLRKLSEIRNGFAHTYIISQEANYKYRDGDLDDIEVTRTIEVMNSKGLIKSEDLDEMYDTFIELYDEISNQLSK